jgi:K+-sensing histidine kinase KdpD
VHDDERECSVSVEDSGPGGPDGVPDAEPELIFKGFYQQIAESPSLTLGGLGLAIVRTVVQAHAGRIEVASASRQSTAFRLIFPVRLPNP